MWFPILRWAGAASSNCLNTCLLLPPLQSPSIQLHMALAQGPKSEERRARSEQQQQPHTDPLQPSTHIQLNGASGSNNPHKLNPVKPVSDGTLQSSQRTTRAVEGIS
ncbi:hypothetical protein DPX16_11858 [Anabarilius grahami]|uniref:Uncharacterized protein n=1 Tax=Anabarilius grahami TaxID=495550 RepID=A0A3N0YC51_ANAGA|nr:hypothetical protein DPX16_11858 [Anabarilius grahami]